MMRRKILSFFFVSLAGYALGAQNLSDLIISEAMPADSGPMLDEYGGHSAWIEIFNTSQGTVNYAGCFITDDPDNLTKCQIPKGYSATKLGPRQAVVLYASGDSSRGVEHLDLSFGKGTTLYLVSNDGRTIIDGISVPEELDYGKSIAKFAHDAKGLDFDDIHPSRPSPGLLNGVSGQKSRAQIMKETDPHGTTLTVVSVSVVFGALIILFLIYNMSGNFFSGKYKRKERAKSVSGKNMDSETAAAIAMALSMEILFLGFRSFFDCLLHNNNI